MEPAKFETLLDIADGRLDSLIRQGVSVDEAIQLKIALHLESIERLLVFMSDVEDEDDDVEEGEGEDE